MEQKDLNENEDFEVFEEVVIEEGDQGEMSANQNETMYIVEKILDVKTKDGKKYYFVKWEGFPSSENTWEPEDQLAQLYPIVEAFEKERQNEMESKEKTMQQEENFEEKSLIIKKKQEIRKPIDLPQDEEDIIFKKIKLNPKANSPFENEEKIPQLPSETSQKNFENLWKDQNQETSSLKVQKSKGGKSDLGAKDEENKNEKSNLIKKKDPLKNLRIKDQPKSILGIKPGKNNSDMCFYIEWETRNNGVKPKNSEMTNQDLRSLYPQFLLDFYESKIVIFSKIPKEQNFFQNSKAPMNSENDQNSKLFKNQIEDEDAGDTPDKEIIECVNRLIKENANTFTIEDDDL